MDEVVGEKFLDHFGLTGDQINIYENFFNSTILPVVKRHFLSHLVTTIEELINEKQKHEFLEHIKDIIKNDAHIDYKMIERAVNQKILRLFSIILVPVESGKLKARTYLMGKGTGAMITYWKELPKKQIRILIAHELGHIANRFLFENANLTSGDGLATLFGYIALQDRNNFYKNKVTEYTNESDLTIFNEIANLCNRGNM